MRKLAIIALMLLPLSAWAQEFAARSSVGAETKLAKGLRLSAEEEVRAADGFASLGSLRTTVDLSYKIDKHFRVNGGFTLINPYKQKLSGFGAYRDRVYVGATAAIKTGDFQFYLKERLQLTHRTDDSLNVYQTTRNALALKSRLGVKYKGLSGLEPFAYVEARTALNEPWGSIPEDDNTVHYSSAGKAYYTYDFSGYTNVYLNRLRLGLGTDWSPAKGHNFTFGVLADYCSDYEIDTNKDGSKIFRDTTGWENTFRLSLSIGYTYKF